MTQPSFRTQQQVVAITRTQLSAVFGSRMKLINLPARTCAVRGLSALPAAPWRGVCVERIVPVNRMVSCSAWMPDEDKLDDTPGVESLLARDMKQPKVQPELLGESFLTPNQEPTPSTSTSSQRTRADGLKSKRQRREDMARAAGVAEGEDKAGPKKCKEAIDKGLELFQARQYQQAIAMFSLALELPGQGAYRLPNSPREYSCPSDAEENAALYNMACAYVQLKQLTSALTCLEAVLDNGYSDYKGILSDPDLQPLGQPLRDLVGKYDGPMAQMTKGFLGAVNGIVGGKKELVSNTERKPWVMW